MQNTTPLASTYLRDKIDVEMAENVKEVFKATEEDKKILTPKCLEELADMFKCSLIQCIEKYNQSEYKRKFIALFSIYCFFQHALREELIKSKIFSEALQEGQTFLKKHSSQKYENSKMEKIKLHYNNLNEMFIILDDINNEEKFINGFVDEECAKVALLSNPNFCVVCKLIGKHIVESYPESETEKQFPEITEAREQLNKILLVVESIDQKKDSTILALYNDADELQSTVKRLKSIASDRLNLLLAAQ